MTTLCYNLNREQANKLYYEVMGDRDAQAMRRLCKEDLFYLLSIGCKRMDVNRDWLYERCREVEAEPNGCLDLWSREHYKSTIITFGLTIKDILNDPELTFGIFSHTRGIAKGFLSQIKTELEENRFLQDLFPDVLYKEPKKHAKVWSLDAGVTVKRKSNPKESTIEAWGLVDGQPTSKHFKVLIYDDVVTLESVTTPDQIKRTNEAWATSRNLGAHGGRSRYIGTRYHTNDTWGHILNKGIVRPRIHPATSDGRVSGRPVFLDKKTLDTKYKEMGPYVFSCQMLQDPLQDSIMGFKQEWLRFYDRLANNDHWNYYLLVDPAGEKKKENDYTVMVVIGLAPDNNYYLVDAIRDRLNLPERTAKLFALHRKWRPLAVGYEKYGKDSDIEHIKYVMELENYRFEITPIGGRTKKNDRIRKLVPHFSNGRFWMPHRLLFYSQTEGKQLDFIQEFLRDEYNTFPVCVHDDMLDCLSRIVEPKLKAVFPEAIENFRGLSMTERQEVNRVETEYDLFA